MSLLRNLRFLIKRYEARLEDLKCLQDSEDPVIDLKQIIRELKDVLGNEKDESINIDDHAEEVMNPSIVYKYSGPSPKQIFLAFEESPNIFKYKLEQSTTSK